jgi:outer membrane protein TolC
VDFSGIMNSLPVSIPSLPLDQYKIWADVNQTIYDGGLTKARKSIEKATFEAEVQQTETDLMSVKQQALQAYFALQATRKNMDILGVSLKELEERKKILQAAVSGGVVLQDNLLAIEAEVLRLRQKLSEIRLTGIQMTKILSVLMDTTLEEDIALAGPDEPIAADGEVTRPEYLLFNWQKEKLAASRDVISAGDLPRLYAFGQGAYGRPGYNMISTKFHTFYSVGIGMKWNFMQYGDSKRQKKLFDIQEELVDIRKQNFDDQLGILISNEKSNRKRYVEMIEQDEQIIALRKEITASAFSKLSNGTVTATDYLEELDKEIVARMQLETHRIQLLQSAYTIQLLQGKL